MNLEVILFLGVMLVSASFLGLLAERLSIPKIAAYILTGAIFSQEVLGQYLYPHGEYWSNDLGGFILSFIGFQIGSTLSMKEIKNNYKTFTIGTLGNSLGAVVAVVGGIIFLGLFTDLAEQSKLTVALAAIAATTAPAGTMAIIRQYKAKGPVTTNLLGLVVLDDALGILIFALLTGLFSASSWIASVSEAGLELFLSGIIGVLVGLSFGATLKRIKTQSMILPLLLGTLFLVLVASEKWKFSAILASMAIGFGSQYLAQNSSPLDRTFETIEDGLYMVLFILAGCHFNLTVFSASIPLMITYIFSRSLGKYVGTYLGLSFVGAPKTVKKYIGLGLIPQAGVAIGLALFLSELPQFKNLKEIVLNVVIGSTIVYEIVGPFLTRYSLVKAGEIK